MSQLNRSPFKLSILVAAMVSLSACSSAPKIAGVDLGKVGSGISKMGSKTAEISSNAWEGTKELLNIGPQESELLDEVDLALMDDDLNSDGTLVASNDLASDDIGQLLPQGDAQSTLTDLDTDQTLLHENNNQQRTLAFGEIPEQPVASGDIILLGQDAQEQPVPEGEMTLVSNAETEIVPLNDLTHEVTESETLWDIAKRTTGDANNWHVIADINNLPPNASVFVGQKITIPADMVKPDYGQVIAAAEEETAQPMIKTDEAASVALNIPEKTEDVVAATAEQIKPATQENAGNILADATAIKVNEGETLWDFAKRTTGDATNWKLLADKNLFSEQQLAQIRPGQKIYVPNDMVRARDENGTLIAKGEESNIPTATAGAVTPKNQQAIDASTAVLAGTNVPAEGEIKIVEAAYQDGEGIKPVTAESLSEEASVAVAAADVKMGKVMVKGTYYPKAVYNEADFSSSLLMRVSPGTQLVVSKAVGPWLEVTTDKGVGYVHSRDIK